MVWGCTLGEWEIHVWEETLCILRKVPQKMAKVVIYSSPFCGFCFRAKGLLNKKGAAFDAKGELDALLSADS